MRLIGLTGPAGSGKDTVASFLVVNHGFVQIALADALRDGVKAMFGITDEQLHRRDLKETPIDWLGRSPRQLLQTLGTEWGRNYVAPDIWLRVAARRIELIRGATPCLHVGGIVVSDIRFENEAAWLRGQDGQLWHIHRQLTLNDGPTSHHCSEQGVLLQEGDATVRNTGTLGRLEEAVAALLEEDC